MAHRLSPTVRDHDCAWMTTLRDGWTVAVTAPGAAADPQGLLAADPRFVPAQVPGTLASVAPEHGVWPPDPDEVDVWYRTAFTVPASVDPDRVLLQFDGLATLADVWVDGAHVLSSDNMFERHAVPFVPRPGGECRLSIRFRALGPELRRRRGRPRWPTPLVREGKLRHVRTALAGRTPALGPMLPAIGPWRQVKVVAPGPVTVTRAFVDGRPGDGVGLASYRFRIDAVGPIRGARLRIGAHAEPVAFESTPEGDYAASGEATVPGARPWWPHTHGEPRLYPLTLEVSTDEGTSEIDLGHTGFRTVDLLGPGFALAFNGERLFLRGAVWTRLDVARLDAGADAYRRALLQVRDAGMNCVRVAGVGHYEHPEFYRECDRLGIVVWQDLMFASMDYDGGDEAFVASVARECEQVLEGVGGHPCVAIVCGSSETQMQAAMMGASLGTRTSLFWDTLARHVRELRPGLPYWPSTPGGAAVPFHPHGGPTHVYGVGAFRRPVDELRTQRPQFAPESLAFAQLPEDETLQELIGHDAMGLHSSEFAARLPRDPGGRVEFGEVVDHYVEAVFGESARELRGFDVERYRELYRIVPAELIARALGYARDPRRSCGGSLVWRLRDLELGAGCGLVDVRGRPKAAWYRLRPLLQPRALWLTDEGLDGLDIHVGNELDAAWSGTLEVLLMRHGGHVVESARRPVRAGPRATETIGVDAVLDRFVDPTRAYRLGADEYDAVVARFQPDSERSAQPDESFLAVHFPSGYGRVRHEDIGLRVEGARADGSVRVVVRTAAIAESVSVVAQGFLPDDNYFHLVPGHPREVKLHPDPAMGGKPPSSVRIRARALNCRATATALVPLAEDGERR